MYKHPTRWFEICVLRCYVPPDTTVGPGLGPHIPGYGNSLGRLLMLAQEACNVVNLILNHPTNHHN